jgi:hypothetical protein
VLVSAMLTALRGSFVPLSVFLVETLEEPDGVLIWSCKNQEATAIKPTTIKANFFIVILILAQSPNWQKLGIYCEFRNVDLLNISL